MYSDGKYAINGSIYMFFVCFLYANLHNTVECMLRCARKKVQDGTKNEMRETNDGYSWFTFIDNLSTGIITKTQSSELIFED